MLSRALRLTLAASAVLLLAGTAASSEADRGYLAKPNVPDAIRLLRPPPAEGSGREADDRAAFLATRKLEGGARWALAASDADLHPDHVLEQFSCAVGVKLNAASAPRVAAVFERVTPNVGDLVNPPKERFDRLRPYQAVPGDLAICVPKSAMLANNRSYPSGHAAISWTWGLILAELAPDRATEILLRARAVGESRAVCGVHYPSDVEAGQLAASSLVAALHGDAGFRADMEGARAEIAALRKAGPAPGGDCAAQIAADEKPAYWEVEPQSAP